MLVPILASPAATRPNFMLILGDDLGFDLAAAYDHPLSVTPHLDRLARSSLVSTGHHAGGATCAPSRAALMSGRSTLAFPNARNNGVGELPTVTDILNQHGYETAHFGKWHLEKGAVNGSYSLQVVGGLDQRQQRHPYSQRREKRLSTSLSTRSLKEEERDAAPGRGVAPTPLCARVAASPWAGQSSTAEARAAAAARPPRRGGERSRGQRGAVAVREQAALLCPPTSAEARRRHAEAVRLAEAEDAAHIKEARAAAKAARAARAAGNISREKVHYTLDPSGGSTRAGASFCSRLPSSKREPRDAGVVAAAVAWLRARDESRPFYANVWLHAPHAPVSAVEALGRPLCEMLGGTAASVLGATPFGHLLAAGAAVDWGSVLGGPMAAKVRAARAAAEGWARRAGRPYPAGALEQARARGVSSWG